MKAVSTCKGCPPARFSLQAVLALGLFLALVLSCTDNPGADFGSLSIMNEDSIRFSALRDVAVLHVLAIDASGAAIPMNELHFISRDPRVASLNDQGVVRSAGNGSTRVVVSDKYGRRDSIGVGVRQVVDSLAVTQEWNGPIRSVPYDGHLGLTCRTFDALGNLISSTATARSLTGNVGGADCAALRVRASGFDTLSIDAGDYHASIPIAIAVQPFLTTPPGAPLAIDSLPAGIKPWAPTVRTNAQGQVELYFTGYVDAPEAHNGFRGHLHRLVSPDGAFFHYDGIAVAFADSVCDPQGNGIENIAIIPRADGPGYRMLFAAGGFDCYGWQVFSAVSTDERVWRREPGVRVSNGGTLPPDDPVPAPYPAGEGMAIDRLPTGEWRMIAGTYAQVEPWEDKFQITEWRSSNQLDWSYQGPVLTTDQVGPLARRSVYSPSIQQIVPGIYRMFFTGDDLNTPGGRSRIFTAVSLDQRNWQVEGALVSDMRVDYFYSSLVGDLLAFIRQPVGGSRTLGVVRVGTR